MISLIKLFLLLFHFTILKLIANGENLVNGEAVPKPAEREFKPERERWLKLQDLEDNFAPDIPPNQSPVTFNCAQVKIVYLWKSLNV